MKHSTFTNFPLLLLYFLTFILGSLTDSNTLNCPIECYCDHTGIITCQGSGYIKKLPHFEVLDPSIQRIEVHSYSLQRVDSRDLLPLLEVKEVVLKGNSIQVLDNETFTCEDESKVQVLDLSENKLIYFIGGLKLRKVKVLDLSSNRLQQVLKLKELESLESVNLQRNQIQGLEGDIFEVRLSTRIYRRTAIGIRQCLRGQGTALDNIPLLSSQFSHISFYTLNSWDWMGQ